MAGRPAWVRLADSKVAGPAGIVARRSFGNVDAPHRLWTTEHENKARAAAPLASRAEGRRPEPVTLSVQLTSK